MKWIGQHIYDLVSRFRDSVYLEDLTTTTETNILVVDSNGLMSKNTTLPGTSGRRYGSTIKILPSDFMINDDAASPLSFKDGVNTGVHVNNTANELVAFVTIPEGMKATHVDIYATHNKDFEVHELDINSSYNFTTGTARGTGTTNTQLDITDTNATATNYLVILIESNATSQRFWGGLVTIAPQ